MKEKNTQETEINKVIEAKKRRGKYCEKDLMEKIVFEKPSKKHFWKTIEKKLSKFFKLFILKNYRSTAYIYEKSVWF